MLSVSWIGWNASDCWGQFPKVSTHSHTTQTEYLTHRIPCVPPSSPFSEVPSQPASNEFILHSQVALFPCSPFVVSPTWFLAFKSSTLWVFWTTNRPLSPYLRCGVYLCCSDQWDLWGGQVLRRLNFNPLNVELNPICHLLALLEAHPIFHVSRIRVKNRASYIYRTGEPLPSRFCILYIFFQQI
jgi:hypothetical protein